MAVLNPRMNIANTTLLEQFECSVCYQLSPQTRRCKGPCHKPFCVKCICRIKISRDWCPHKCSSPFQTQPIPQFEVVFRCPYDPACCSDLVSQSQFEEHCLDCPLGKGSFQLQNFLSFRCEKGHQLQLLTPTLMVDFNSECSFYSAVMNAICASCGGHALCRAVCLQCSSPRHPHLYCVDCRRLPIVKTSCNYGHLYEGIYIEDDYYWVCDLCGIAGTMVSRSGAYDRLCDVFLCYPCYTRLPERHKQPQQKQMVSPRDELQPPHPSP